MTKNIDRLVLSVTTSYGINKTLMLSSGMAKKLDVKHAFRIVPVEPQHWDLLGTFWNGYYFVELRMRFGCGSSIFIFNTFDDALAWTLRVKHAIANLVYYLDDFFTCGASKTDECARNINRIIKVFENRAMPLAVDKLIGPVTVIIYLGTEIDSDMFITLPAEKLSELLALLNVLHDRKKCTK